MKILWITNIPFPDICEKKGWDSPVIGGWMYSSAKTLIGTGGNISLAVATVYKGDKLEKHIINDITYYLLPLKGNVQKVHKSLDFHWQCVVSDFQPDVTHLHGTELGHGLSYLRACPNNKIVVSIQGLVSVYERYYLAGMNLWDVVRSTTLRTWLGKDDLWQGKRNFYRRGKIECEIITRAKHVIGRTSWDEAHCLAINPHVNYHFCNETLRGEFYKHTWSYEKCEKHSIFLSQASYPIKGLHQLIKALPFILRSYPDTKVYVGGANIVKCNTWKEYLKQTGYGKYIKYLMKKYHVEDKVIFLGSLNETQICEQYLKTNVFVCPSSIENSPNSLGEAQLMGVPCVASYVGGVPDMMKGCEEYMYRFEEVEMLAEKVCEIFAKKGNITSLIQKYANERHNNLLNNECLVNIYKEIIDRCYIP